jgi:hypothetical protein
VLALGIAGQLTRLSTFIIAFVATTLVIIAVSAICPAAGPWLFPRYRAGNRQRFPAAVVEQLAGVSPRRCPREVLKSA